LAGVVVALGGCGGTAKRAHRTTPSRTASTATDAAPSGTRLASPVARAARQLVLEGASSAVVFVADGRRVQAAAAGRGARADQRFRVGSVTKTFTATIVLQLIDEGRLHLDDPVARYLPGLVPAARGITIRQLLDHRSGLANFTDDGPWMVRAERSGTIRPRDVLRFAASRDPVFRAGTRWSYSNTNYVALGLVIEKLTGHSFARELRQRILAPLRLAHTQLATTRRVAGLSDAGTNPNLPWAAGSVVSDGPDLARFYAALLSGRLLSRARLGAMERTVATDSPMLRDGLGIFALKLPGCGEVWGHEGGILDYATLVQARMDGSRVVVISLRGPAPPQAPSTSQFLCPSPG
jgi:D-alanyl-D-alanine carboxypeptidase